MAQPAAVFTFRDAEERLVAQVRTRMRNGELTERALARRLGVSQSHINNVLRGRRNLSHELADSILKFLHYSLLDLHHDIEVHSRFSETTAGTSFVVEVLKHRIGPGQNWSTARHGEFRYHTPCVLTEPPDYSVFRRLPPHDRLNRALIP